jgi:hypothetical protein
MRMKTDWVSRSKLRLLWHKLRLDREDIVATGIGRDQKGEEYSIFNTRFFAPFADTERQAQTKMLSERHIRNGFEHAEE